MMSWRSSWDGSGGSCAHQRNPKTSKLQTHPIKGPGWPSGNHHPRKLGVSPATT
ncbi:uncharacterized protein PGTG_11087 [Puccinia graminis f. sp. tritici CRL 75-36-700-3]|uniref:Uncharacterized protein n=1 Tax=Puccinia graminis f. sp. tritici (strain CRL 75-36-700-3 / race SCCL) TaxID=418459 RepID=E3KNC2_PUCGT|nr:uncharacterized protein PGTG_11087 [Puccinia graminis f. sp. tritici CRL 75-36-700-3]EFP85758.1 hypothetical protein PGTG_11087 [Puccinia graminis f. sp. tritici CRL 75-36-700-3]